MRHHIFMNTLHRVFYNDDINSMLVICYILCIEHNNMNTTAKKRTIYVFWILLSPGKYDFNANYYNAHRTHIYKMFACNVVAITVQTNVIRP